MGKEVTDMTIKELTEFLSAFLKESSDPTGIIRIDGKPIRAIGFRQAKDGNPEYLNLETDPDLTGKAPQPKKPSYKITRVDVK